ncbi:MAG TPA: hypothetical protein VEC57_21010 [Candidatus Limnocylindrales bacterium]|nr:hypothetical protein [Candidatus Limnocylindrales bacterium]
MADNEPSTTETSTSATVETTAAPSMEDTIRSTLAEIKTRGSDDQAGAPEASKDPEGSPGRTRDPAGRFSKAAAPDDGKPGTPAVKAEAPAATDTPVADKFAEAPKSWKSERKAEWATLPPTVREEIHRREEDFHQGIEKYRGKAATFDTLDAVIRPHADVFQAAGQNAVENISGLLNFQRTLYNGSDAEKVYTLLQIASNVGIKPEAIVEGLNNPQRAPVQDPRYDSLLRDLQETRQIVSQVKLAPVMSQVESFMADPKNEFVGEPEVQAEMERLLKSGSVQTLQQAYDKACRLSDSVQAKVEARKREAEAKQKADLAANARKVSSINVRTRGATPAGSTAKGTMEDTIRARLAELKAEGRA